MKTILHIPFVSWALAIAWATIVWGGIALSLTSCGAIIGWRQTNPNGYTPTVVEKWWMEQNAHKNSR